MRRKITLYIAGERCDLSSASLILYNWTQEDAANPTAVKNAYSQQVTLPGTAANNRIFGDIWRPDRTTAENGQWTGTGFDALKKTPFDLYADTGEILQSGYVRLDSIERKGNRVSYKVTLFGGLGSLFYSLSYSNNGEVMSLADLDYTDLGGPGELDFRINAANVLAAWADLGTGADPLWRVINFAPAYEGIPDKDFDATKAIVDPDDIGLTAPITKDGKTYRVNGGKCLVNLPQAVDQWAVKDLRSYLQRPVINFGHVIRAIKRKAEANGYTFDISTLATDMGSYGVEDTNRCSALWLTLPQLTTLTLHEDAAVTISKSSAFTASNPVATWTISGSAPTGTKMQVTTYNTISFKMADTSGSLRFWVDYPIGPGVPRGAKAACIFFRLVGKVAGSPVVSSKIVCASLYPQDSGIHLLGNSPKTLFDLFGDNSYTDEDFYSEIQTFSQYPIVDDAVTITLTRAISLDVEGYDLDSVDLEVVKSGALVWGMNAYYPNRAEESTGIQLPIWRNGNSTNIWTTQIKSGSLASPYTDAITVDTATTVRSGATITKADLLGSTKTPAQYLLSYAKMLGLYFAFDGATKTVTLLKRAEFYNGPTIDLTKRIDRRTISIKPVAVDSKWYQFKDETKGAFADEYEKTYGRTYGAQKVNTGYAFNDNVKDLISGSVLRGAVSALERSKYFNWIETIGGGDFRPSVFLDEGVTYTLWTTTGENLDTDVQIPASDTVTVNYYNQNADLEGYDAEFANKLQLHAADGKGVDGDNILCFLEGRNTYEYFKVSDDDASMHNITGGKGCWDLTPGSAAGLEIPIFQRYTFKAGNYHVDESLDYGVPAALAFPRQIYNDDDGTLYARGWRAYLHDRYDGDTKVMTCKVDLAGLRVDGDLLRNFYWYEGALWTLNKISNYAMTTHAPTQCEFVQVQDPAAYTSGQNFD